MVTCCARDHPDYVSGWKSLLFPVTLAATFIWVVLTNALSGDNNRIVSDMFPTFFTPQGWAFSIWGVIYLWQAMLVVLAFVDRGNPWLVCGATFIFPLNYLVNGVWIFLFNPDTLVWSAVVMVGGILLTLIVLYHRLGISYYRSAWGRAWGTVTDPNAPRDREPLRMSAWTFFILQPAVSWYLAWICVATVANISIVAVSMDTTIEAATQARWSMIMQTVAALIALVFVTMRGDPFFGAVIAWALFAIADKQGTDQPDFPQIAAVATALASLVASYTILVTLANLFNYAGLEFRMGGARLAFRGAGPSTADAEHAKSMLSGHNVAYGTAESDNRRRHPRRRRNH